MKAKNLIRGCEYHYACNGDIGLRFIARDDEANPIDGYMYYAFAQRNKLSDHFLGTIWYTEREVELYVLDTPSYLRAVKYIKEILQY